MIKLRSLFKKNKLKTTTPSSVRETAEAVDIQTVPLPPFSQSALTTCPVNTSSGNSFKSEPVFKLKRKNMEDPDSEESKLPIEDELNQIKGENVELKAIIRQLLSKLQGRQPTDACGDSMDEVYEKIQKIFGQDLCSIAMTSEVCGQISTSVETNDDSSSNTINSEKPSQTQPALTPSSQDVDLTSAPAEAQKTEDCFNFDTDSNSQQAKPVLTPSSQDVDLTSALAEVQKTEERFNLDTDSNSQQTQLALTPSSQDVDLTSAPAEAQKTEDCFNLDTDSNSQQAKPVLTPSSQDVDLTSAPAEVQKTEDCFNLDTDSNSQQTQLALTPSSQGVDLTSAPAEAQKTEDCCNLDTASNSQQAKSALTPSTQDVDLTSAPVEAQKTEECFNLDTDSNSQQTHLALTPSIQDLDLTHVDLATIISGLDDSNCKDLVDDDDSDSDDSDALKALDCVARHQVSAIEKNEADKKETLDVLFQQINALLSDISSDSESEMKGVKDVSSKPKRGPIETFEFYSTKFKRSLGLSTTALPPHSSPKKILTSVLPPHSGPKKILTSVLPPHSGPKKILTSVLPPRKKYEPPIRVHDANMDQVIEAYRHYKKVAFAHCISADFNSPRQMTAGVAVKMKKAFGRPRPCDLVGSHLTRQMANEGAGVYALITKCKYFKKPAPRDYDEAFRQLTIEFKSKKYERLICSPMGCVRDKITIERFVRNLTLFQQTTKAVIDVVTYAETSNRVLKSGLSHEEFMDSLKIEILKQYRLLNPSKDYRFGATEVKSTRRVSSKQGLGEGEQQPSCSRTHTTSPVLCSEKSLVNIVRDESNEATVSRYSQNVPFAALEIKINEMEESTRSMYREMTSKLEEMASLQLQIAKIGTESEHLRAEQSILNDAANFLNERMKEIQAEKDQLLKRFEQNEIQSTCGPEGEHLEMNELQAAFSKHVCMENENEPDGTAEKREKEGKEEALREKEEEEEALREKEDKEEKEEALREKEDKEEKEEALREKEDKKEKEEALREKEEKEEALREKEDALREKEEALREKEEKEEALREKEEALREEDEAEKDFAAIKDNLAQSEAENIKLKNTIEVLQQSIKLAEEKAEKTKKSLEEHVQSLHSEKENMEREVTVTKEQVEAVEKELTLRIKELEFMKNELIEFQVKYIILVKNFTKLDKLYESLMKCFEVESAEWKEMQDDLLVAVRVANDLKTESQELLKRAEARVVKLQKENQQLQSKIGSTVVGKNNDMNRPTTLSNLIKTATTSLTAPMPPIKEPTARKTHTRPSTQSVSVKSLVETIENINKQKADHTRVQTGTLDSPVKETAPLPLRDQQLTFNKQTVSPVLPIINEPDEKKDPVIPLIDGTGSRRNALLNWVKNKMEGYPNIEITNFSSSWADGLALCALLHSYLPDKVPFKQLSSQNQDAKQNFEIAFSAAESVGIPTILSFKDMIEEERPNWQKVMAYVKEIYMHFEGVM